MSATADTTADHARDRSVPLLIAAGVLVVAVVAIVLLVGVERPPEVLPLQAEPAVEVPSPVAWLDRDDADVCLRVLTTDGGEREVTCDLDGELWGWNDEGIVVREWSGGSDRLTVVDPATGDRTPADDPGIEAEAGETTPWVEREDGRFTVRLVGPDGVRGDVLWDTEAPASYDIVSAVPSPDGSVVAMVDSASRLLVVPADGSVEPRLWRDRFSPYMPFVWEGTEPGSAGGF